MNNALTWVYYGVRGYLPVPGPLCVWQDNEGYLWSEPVEGTCHVEDL